MSRVRNLIQEGIRAFSTQAEMRESGGEVGGFPYLPNGVLLGVNRIDYGEQWLNVRFNDRSHIPMGDGRVRVNNKYGRPLKKGGRRRRRGRR